MNILKRKACLSLVSKLIKLPAFYTRESDFGVDYRLEQPVEVAAAMKAKWDMGLKGGMVIANPIPHEHALDKALIDGAIARAVAEMDEKGIGGKGFNAVPVGQSCRNHRRSQPDCQHRAGYTTMPKLAAEIAPRVRGPLISCF